MSGKNRKQIRKGIRIDKIGEIKLDILDEKFNYIGRFTLKDLIRKGLI